MMRHYPTLAEQALAVDKERIWLQCFRLCVRCEQLHDSLTHYEFSDGSSVTLDASASFPMPVADPVAPPHSRRRQHA